MKISRRWIFWGTLLLEVTVIALALVTCAEAAPPKPKDTAVCDWNNPGRAVYTGRWDTAVDSFTTIPAPVRNRLKARLLAGKYDDLATISATSITGNAGAYGALSYMHSGKASRCVAVDRSRWTPEHRERAMVFCDSGHCIVRPSVCNNIAIVGAPVAPTAPTPGAPMLPEVPPTPAEPIPGVPTPVEPVALTPPPAGSFAEVAEGDGLGWLALGALALLLGGGRLAGGGGPTFLPMPPTHVPGIPEPATGILLILGIAVVCLVASRRLARKRDAAWADTVPVPGTPKRTEPSWSVLTDAGRYTPSIYHTKNLVPRIGSWGATQENK